MALAKRSLRQPKSDERRPGGPSGSSRQEQGSAHWKPDVLLPRTRFRRKRADREPPSTSDHASADISVPLVPTFTLGPGNRETQASTPPGRAFYLSSLTSVATMQESWRNPVARLDEVTGLPVSGSLRSHAALWKSCSTGIDCSIGARTSRIRKIFG